jgi:hypothetical protein
MAPGHFRLRPQDRNEALVLNKGLTGIKCGIIGLDGNFRFDRTQMTEGSGRPANDTGRDDDKANVSS